MIVESHHAIAIVTISGYWLENLAQGFPSNEKQNQSHLVRARFAVP